MEGGRKITVYNGQPMCVGMIQTRRPPKTKRHDIMTIEKKRKTDKEIKSESKKRRKKEQ